MARPICVHCAKPYGSRATESETVRWDAPVKLTETTRFGGRVDKFYVHDGEAPPPPPYKGNKRVLKESTPFLNATDGRMVITRDLWDGETWWVSYAPFCTLRCALDYARKAYKKIGALP